MRIVCDGRNAPFSTPSEQLGATAVFEMMAEWLNASKSSGIWSLTFFTTVPTLAWAILLILVKPFLSNTCDALSYGGAV